MQNKEEVVLIEACEESLERCRSLTTLLYVQGDATEDDNLLAAGITRAAGIIITLPSDKENLYITMTARMLNSGIRIISRMTDAKLKPKLIKAGADQVVSPNAIGALRMASEMIRPTVVDFLDGMLRCGREAVRIHQILVSEQSLLIGKKTSESGLRERYNLMVPAARHRGQPIVFNPPLSRTSKPVWC